MTPRVPNDKASREQLDANLMRMRCSKLQEHPWDLRDEDVVREVLIGPTNEWDHALRAQPDKWTAELWREAYGFGKARSGIYTGVENFTEGRFSSKSDPKDGLTIEDCINPRARRILEYLVPIFYLERPT